MKQDFLTIATFDDYQVALLFQSKLRTFGIQSNISGYTPFLEGTPDGIKLQVRNSDVSLARKVMGNNRIWKRKVNHARIFGGKFEPLFDKKKPLMVGTLTANLIILPYLTGLLIPPVFTQIENVIVEAWVNGFFLLCIVGLLFWIIITIVIFTRRYMFPRKE